MPYYDYRCPDCGAHFPDLLLPMTHEKPSCHFCDTVMVQILSPPVTRFKGDGWTPPSHTPQDKHEERTTPIEEKAE